VERPEPVAGPSGDLSVATASKKFTLKPYAASTFGPVKKVEFAGSIGNLSYAKTPSGGQAVDISALIRTDPSSMITLLLHLLRLMPFLCDVHTDRT